MPTKHAEAARRIMDAFDAEVKLKDQWATACFVCAHAMLEIAAQIERLADARQRRHGHTIGGDDEFAKYERQFAGES